MSGYIKQTSVYDAGTGELIREVVSRGSPNGRGWVIVYTENVQELLLKCNSAATLKVFMYLAVNQQFEERGFITTKTAVQEKLGITKKTCIEAFNWLKENMIINEMRVNGCTEFMVNPRYVTVGRDKKAREKEWVKRWTGGTVGVIKELGEKKKIKLLKKGEVSIS